MNHRVLVRNVSGNGVDIARQCSRLFACFLKRRCPTSGDHNRVSTFAQSDRRGTSDARSPACHDADLARPVKALLEQMPSSPVFKLAGFVTHASYLPEGGDWEEQVHEKWAARCALTLRQASQEKGIEFLGYYGCMGAPSPPIEQFIHSQIVTDEEEWERYLEEVRGHPDDDDLRRAAEFAAQVLARS